MFSLDMSCMSSHLEWVQHRWYFVDIHQYYEGQVEPARFMLWLHRKFSIASFTLNSTPTDMLLFLIIVGGECTNVKSSDSHFIQFRVCHLSEMIVFLLQIFGACLDLIRFRNLC